MIVSINLIPCYASCLLYALCLQPLGRQLDACLLCYNYIWSVGFAINIILPESLTLHAAPDC